MSNTDIQFDGSVVIITGAGSGLGKAYALEFAKRGASVVVNDLGGTIYGLGHDSVAADLVVKEIKKAGGIAVPSYDSVITMEGGKNIVKTALDNFGKIDVLVNNAGIIKDKSFLKLTEDDWDQVIAVHLKGAFCVTQPVFAIMKENGYGKIINTASGAGLYGNFGQANYCAAKMGLIGLMNSICIEGAKYNIKCNTIVPVATSRMTEKIIPVEMLQKFKPEFVVPLVIYLSSKHNTTTKQIFNCAAGWYSRTEILCADGICIDDGNREITAEEVADNFEKISDLSNAKPLANLIDTFGYLNL